LLKIFVSELVGSLIFIHGLVASTGSETPNFYVALSLFAGISFAYPFSKGHLNPATSLAYLFTEAEFSLYLIWEFLVRKLAQCLGAFLGGITAWLVVNIITAPTIDN